MKIKNKGSENLFKGRNNYESKSEFMEEDILQIFLNKIGSLPIAQNILITNKETSYEEMQAFLKELFYANIIHYLLLKSMNHFQNISKYI